MGYPTTPDFHFARTRDDRTPWIALCGPLEIEVTHVDSNELLMAMERALEARRALKDWFKSAASKAQWSARGKSHEAALLEKVSETRNEFELILGKYVDERIQAAIYNGEK